MFTVFDVCVCVDAHPPTRCTTNINFHATPTQRDRVTTRAHVHFAWFLHAGGVVCVYTPTLTM